LVIIKCKFVYLYSDITSVLLHYSYELLHENSVDEEGNENYIYLLRSPQNNYYKDIQFGTYSTVSPNVLERIYIKNIYNQSDLFDFIVKLSLIDDPTSYPLVLAIDSIDLILNLYCTGIKDHDFVEKCKKLHTILEYLAVLSKKGVKVLCSFCTETNKDSMTKYHLKLYDILAYFFRLFVFEQKQGILSVREFLPVQDYNICMSLQSMSLTDDQKHLNKIIELINNIEI
jgi:hypothetical protein